MAVKKQVKFISCIAYQEYPSRAQNHELALPLLA
jgi:hypothetical protein